MQGITKLGLSVLAAETVFAGVFAFGGLMHGVAYADTTKCYDESLQLVDPARCPTYVTEDGNIYRDVVLLSDLYRIDDNEQFFAECREEDCSDQPGQVGMWLDKDTGNWYLSLGEKSYLVIDDTVK
jgi:hypothetical protein